jgi:hypothetical protein
LDELVQPKIDHVIILYKEMQPGYKEMQQLDGRVEEIKGLEIGNIPLKQNTLLIIDDQMTDSMKDKEVQELFISGVHHKSISVIFLTQNLYCQG